MRVFLDANILLDVALKRPGLHDASEAVLQKCADNGWELWISWHTAANVYYILASRNKQQALAKAFLSDLVRLVGVKVSATGTVHLERAFALGMGDFEDAMQVAAAEAAEAQIIVTRNLADFAASPVRAVSPEVFVTLT